MEVKIEGREKVYKKFDIRRDEMFRMKCWVHPFLTTKVMEKFWKS
jgi:hypothetical protein